MKNLTTIAAVRAQVAEWRQDGAVIGFVPTMGNLHAGHLRLVEEARRAGCDRVVVSIFVNPSQFGPGEDFSAYPRTPDADADHLRGAGADLLYLPGESEIYPRQLEQMTQLEVPGLSDDLCGAFRPGHFRGVATVVLKLLNQVQPDLAAFGEKDFQQLTLIRRMVADLDVPVRILGVPTVREPSGLAMSSRNSYLSGEERAQAAGIYAELCRAGERLRAGGMALAEIETDGARCLRESGFVVDYFAVRRPEDLSVPLPEDRAWIVLVAARLGGTRLIDNLSVSSALEA